MTFYWIPFVAISAKNTPEARRRLRALAKPLQEGYVEAEGRPCAWPRGSLIYLEFNDEDGRALVALPARFSPGVAGWDSPVERQGPLPGPDGYLFVDRMEFAKVRP